MGSGPCLCGAEDCPRCYPGCDRVRECEGCGEEFRLFDLDWDYLCEKCAEEKAKMEASGEGQDEE